jgi:cellulose synthase/poly-beta-1,6-N-acetylglucosamine synthase-like glycosyltransferase
MRLFVLIPCRNEARVIARKLENLRGLRFPCADAPHRVVVVDDHSSDETRALATAFGAQLQGGVELRVIASGERPGKPGAMRTGLKLLEPGFDLVVLSDADVLLQSDTLTSLSDAFAARAELGMACGAQVFVDPLSGAPSDAPWDRWTARWRALESRAGALYSVHGQLLAWRAALTLVPPLGIAADDIALALEVRARGLRVERVPRAVFIEHKPPAGADADGQALRRARAYLQVVRAVRPHLPSVLGRVQCALYRELPPMAPLLTWIACSALAFGGALLLEGWWRALPATLIAVGLCTVPGRRWLALMGIIARARKLERSGTQPEAWEMSRS